ncbi:hypothetical protein SCG7109_AC_00020 [Chlamydiales bacterium SCGC AG-110-M15]|nr:hypothetical protein SCG7109_AC_00020 [Chlamydiales bacterium SCGC AG-110-M15]
MNAKIEKEAKEREGVLKFADCSMYRKRGLRGEPLFGVRHSCAAFLEESSRFEVL